jgi:CRP-like cAMP-binding protein
MLRKDSQEISVFKGFTARQLELLGTAFESFYLPSGTHVFEQGQTADYLYILTSGKVIIRYKPYDGPPLNVATIEKGGVFGWSVALGRNVYSSGALVVEDSQGYRISKEQLMDLCAEAPKTSAVLLKQLASVVNNRMDPTYAAILKILEDGTQKDCSDSQRNANHGR